VGPSAGAGLPVSVIMLGNALAAGYYTMVHKV
jgi:hypothetical protein